MANAKALFERRKRRNRYRLLARAGGKPRLSVFRSNKHIYAQVIDDGAGKTLAAASTMDAAMRSNPKAGVDAATSVGALIAERARAAGINVVVFDRGGYRYHGQVKALAEAAREGGLSF